MAPLNVRLSLPEMLQAKAVCIGNGSYTASPAGAAGGGEGVERNQEGSNECMQACSQPQSSTILAGSGPLHLSGEAADLQQVCMEEI